MEHLHTEFKRAKRYGEGMALVLLDIDHFKLINDQHGHPTGDRALVAIGQCLQRTCRNTDVVARIGGEEFAMILPHDATQAIQFFTERLRLEIAGLIVENDGRNEVSITASLGIAHYDESVASVDILFAQADRALYAAKQAGRNKVCIFHPDHDNEADRFPIAA